jgi:hypothetical protein
VNVYYQNALKSASFSMTNTAGGETAEDLVHQDLERTVSCSAPSSLITAVWAPQNVRIADALFISNTNAEQGSLALYDQNGQLAQALSLELGGWNNKIEFPHLAVGRMELALDAGSGGLYAGLVFLSLGTLLPRFTAGVDMSDELRGTGERSFGGQTYGMAGVTLETLSLSWQRITDGERRIMRRYIDAVQFNVNHYISPYEGIDMYAAITGAGTWKKHDSRGFYWDTNIKYREAR